MKEDSQKTPPPFTEFAKGKRVFERLMRILQRAVSTDSRKRVDRINAARQAPALHLTAKQALHPTHKRARLSVHTLSFAY